MLREFKLFKDLTEEELDKLLTFFKKVQYSKKQPIEFSGSTKDYIYLVRSGRVKVSYLSPDGKEITVAILLPGDIYSFHSEAATTVLENAEIWYIESGEFLNILLQKPVLALNVIRLLGTILKNTNDALLNLAFKEVNSRLAGLILKMAQDKGNPEEDGGVSFDLNLTHEEIAKLISSSRQTVTTVLHRFEKMGVIELRKRKIIVKKIDELMEISN